MPVQQLSAWAIHLYARQQRRHQGEDIEVFAFYVLDKRRRPDDVNGGRSSAGQNLNQPGEEQSLSQGPRIRADLSDDDPTGPAPTLDKNIVFEVGSPGSAGGYWKNRITFLRGLCTAAEYQKLVSWLSENQVVNIYIKFRVLLMRFEQTRSSLAAPDGWRSQLLWSRWTYTGHWMPSDMYDDEKGFESIENYVRQWKENLATLAQSKSHIEHLLLLTGMISRDIFAFQFSANDPDEVDNCPSYCHNVLFNVPYHDTLMKLLEGVHEKACTATHPRGRSIYLWFFP